MKLRILLIITCLAISLIPIGIISGLQNFQIATAFLLLILAVTFFVSYVISYFISRPLVTLTKDINEISKGNLDVELEKSEIKEINNLTESLDRVMASLKLAIYKVGVKKGEIFEEAVKAKEEAERKYEILLKKIDGWVWEINDQGCITNCSSKIIETLGYSVPELMGKKIVGLFSFDEGQKVQEYIEKCKQGNNDTTVKMDIFWLHSHHYPVWIRTYMIPMIDEQRRFHGVRCFSRDISEYKIAQEKIEELQKKLDALKKNITPSETQPMPVPSEPASQEVFDYMFMFDEQGKIVDCTEDIHKKLGYEKKEMLTLSLQDFRCLETSDDLHFNMDAVKKQGMIQLKTIHKKKDGSSVFVSEHIKYVKDRNMFICFVKEDFTPKRYLIPISQVN